MKVKTKYVLLKKSIYKKIVSYDFDESFEIHKNKNKESMGTIKFYDEKIISGAINRSIDNRFKKLLELIVSLDESDEDPSDGYIFCLDELAKFRRELINKYNKFLEKKQAELINKKIELIEKNIKNKLLAYRLINSQKEEKKNQINEEKNRRR